MNKKLIALTLSLGLTFTAAGVLTAGNAIKADALVKENIIGNNMITDDGIINELDWLLVGGENSYEPYILGDRLEAKAAPWGASFLTPFDKTSFADGSVTMEFDVFYMKNGCMAPYFTQNLMDGEVSKITVGGPDNGMLDGSADPNANKIAYYHDEALTTPWGAPADVNSRCWQILFGVTPGEMSYHVQYIYKQEGVMGIKTSTINADGTQTPYQEMWAYVGYEVNTTTEYRFGIFYWGDLTVDNFKISTPSKTVFETDFSGMDWNAGDSVAEAPGKMFNTKASPIRISQINATLTNEDRIVSELKVKTDKSFSKAFMFSGAVDFKTVGEFGFATGLKSQSQAFDAEGVSYVYFTHADGVTYLNVTEDGQAVGTPVALGDLVTGGLVDFNLTVKTTGEATFVLGDETVNFTLNAENLDGYFAMGNTGDETAEVALNHNTKLICYAYRASEGDAIASNFNTNWINPEDWEIVNGNPVMFEDVAEARGILAEDGKIKFAGVSHGSYMGTTQAYGEYVVEFLFEEFYDADKPKLLDSYELGYAPLTMILGIDTPTSAPSAWAEKTMINFFEGYIQLLDFKQEPLVVQDVVTNYNFKPSQSGQTKTTAVKMVVMNQTVTIYVQEVVEGVDPSDAKWQQIAQIQTADTYGKVNFACTEAAVFNLDDIRITPIDDPDPAKVAQNAANYVGFQPIADESRPITLQSPLVLMEGNVISWLPVQDATGYIVIVNGQRIEVGADVLSYTITLEPGDYTVTVVAKGNGAWISDSEQSLPIEFTVQAQNSSEEKSGCGSFIADGSLLLVAAAVGFVAIAKKRKQDE